MRWSRKEFVQTVCTWYGDTNAVGLYESTNITNFFHLIFTIFFLMACLSGQTVAMLFGSALTCLRVYYEVGQGR